MTKKIELDVTERWMTEASTVTTAPAMKLPLMTVLKEAVELATFVRRRWMPTEAGQGHDALPGLSDANVKGQPRIALTVADELEQLEKLVLEAHIAFTMDPNRSRAAAPRDRGLALLSELDTTLEFLFADEAYEAPRTQLEQIRHDLGKAPSTMTGMAASLKAFATLAIEHRDALGKLPAFDETVVDEALAMSDDLLRTRPSAKQVTRDVKARRDGLLSLLLDRMTSVRAVARFVFRNHPAIVREATSNEARKAQKVRRDRETKKRVDAGSKTA